MEEWKTYTLGELSVDGKGSYGIGAPAVEYSPDKYTYLRITDINDDGTLAASDRKSVDAEGAENYILKENDIVFARTGNSTGRAYFYDSRDGELVYAGFLIKFSLDPNKVNPKILKYYTHSKPYYDWVRSFDSGATRGNINAQTFASMPIELPSRTTQDRIVDIMSAIDDKIRNNNRINHNLEEQAQALYKSWFVDFEPFKGGKFIQSRVGLIPETWAIQRICDLPLYISDYVSNGSFASLKENVTLYETPNYAQFIRNTDLKCRQFSVWVDQKSYEYLAKSKLEGGEIIISNVGDVGSVHICPQLNTPMTLGNNVIMIKPLDNIYKYFIYMTFKWFHGKDLIKGITGGSAMPKFNKTDFKSLNLLIPDYSTLCKFNSLVSNLFENTISLNSSNQRLSEIRDTLLPKLMSGELKINDLTC